MQPIHSWSFIVHITLFHEVKILSKKTRAEKFSFIILRIPKSNFFLWFLNHCSFPTLKYNKYYYIISRHNIQPLRRNSPSWKKKKTPWNFDLAKQYFQMNSLHFLYFFNVPTHIFVEKTSMNKCFFHSGWRAPHTTLPRVLHYLIQHCPILILLLENFRKRLQN